MSRLTIAVLLLAGCLSGGCEHMASIDQHTFKSTPLLPATVSLVDLTNKEEFWRYEVPVCHRLRINFNRSPEFEMFYKNTEPASRMHWKLQANDGLKALEEGECELNGCRPFIIKVTYREAPEVPADDPGMLPNCPDCPKPGTAPMTQTAEAEADASPVARGQPTYDPSRVEVVYQTPAPQVPPAPPAPAVPAYAAAAPATQAAAAPTYAPAQPAMAAYGQPPAASYGQPAPMPVYTQPARPTQAPQPAYTTPTQPVYGQPQQVTGAYSAPATTMAPVQSVEVIEPPVYGRR